MYRFLNRLPLYAETAPEGAITISTLTKMKNYLQRAYMKINKGKKLQSLHNI